MRKTITAIFAVMLPMTVNAQDGMDIVATFGSWHVVKRETTQELSAVSLNDSDNLIVFRCFLSDKTCEHVFTMSSSCEKNIKYPILINSDYSALFMEAVCGENNELYLTKYDEINKILKKDGNIGFAMPMESGQFKVVRFNLNGSAKAMDYVEKKTVEAKSDETYL